MLPLIFINDTIVVSVLLLQVSTFLEGVRTSLEFSDITVNGTLNEKFDSVDGVVVVAMETSTAQHVTQISYSIELQSPAGKWAKKYLIEQ